MPRVAQTARFILFLMSCSLCLPQGRGPEADPDASSLAIVMEFDDDCSSLSLESMKNELESVFRESGIRLQWRFLAKSRGREVFNRLAVVRFRGDCSTEQGLTFSANRTALGGSHFSDGSVLPFLELNCPRIYQQVRPVLACQTLARKQLLFGRALARVLAHELYHYLANTREHGHCGITKRALTPEELVNGRLVFAGRELATLRNLIASAD